MITAAKAALRRKKTFEHALDQTSAQILTLENQIYSIETANINKETLDAMKNAGSAMEQIHAGLTIDKVDDTMYFPLSLSSPYQPTNAHPQGTPPRTTRHRRRNQRSHYIGCHQQRHRRRRA